MMNFLESIFHGYSQVFLQKNSLMGVLIMIGLAIASPIALIMSLLGVFTSLGVGLALGAEKSALEAGLYCFNGVLIGVAATVFLKHTFIITVITVVASIVATFLFYAFAKHHLIALTAPFILVTWAMILTAKYLK